MSSRQLTALLTLLRRHGVTSYSTPDLSLTLDASAVVTPPKRARVADVGPELEDDEEEDQGDPRFALERFYSDEAKA